MAAVASFYDIDETDILEDDKQREEWERQEQEAEPEAPAGQPSSQAEVEAFLKLAARSLPPLPDDPTRFDGDPTPEEIRAMCLAFQSHWTEGERRRRAGGRADD